MAHTFDYSFVSGVLALIIGAIIKDQVDASDYPSVAAPADSLSKAFWAFFLILRSHKKALSISVAPFQTLVSQKRGTEKKEKRKLQKKSGGHTYIPCIVFAYPHSSFFYHLVFPSVVCFSFSL